jgi:hypothetical protein
MDVRASFPVDALQGAGAVLQLCLGVLHPLRHGGIILAAAQALQAPRVRAAHAPKRRLPLPTKLTCFLPATVSRGWRLENCSLRAQQHGTERQCARGLQRRSAVQQRGPAARRGRRCLGQACGRGAGGPGAAEGRWRRVGNGAWGVRPRAAELWLTGREQRRQPLSPAPAKPFSGVPATTAGPHTGDCTDRSLGKGGGATRGSGRSGG